MEGESLSGRTLKITGVLVLIASFLGLFYIATDLFLLTFLAMLLALGLRGTAQWVSNHTRLSQAWSLAAVTAFLLGAFVAMGILAAPQLAKQADELSRQLPKVAKEAENRIRSYHMGERLLTRATEAAPGLQNPGKILSRVGGTLTRTFGILGNIVFVLAMMVFFVLEPGTYRDPFIRLFPRDGRKRIGEVLDLTGHSLRMWLLGRVLSMFIISVLTGLGLWWIGVPLALLLALLAGLLNFIPNLGPVLALIPAVLLTLPMGFQTVVLAIGLYTGVQFLESYIFTPIIQKKAIDLPPALLLFSQVILGLALGFLGLLLATPLMAVGIVLVRTLYMEDALGDRQGAARGG
jgi:predicted PurR-regulated permease PerM